MKFSLFCFLLLIFYIVIFFEKMHIRRRDGICDWFLCCCCWFYFLFYFKLFFFDWAIFCLKSSHLLIVNSKLYELYCIPVLLMVNLFVCWNFLDILLCFFVRSFQNSFESFSNSYDPFWKLDCVWLHCLLWIELLKCHHRRWHPFSFSYCSPIYLFVAVVIFLFLLFI